MQYLEYAIQLAEMVEGQTGTNPAVGAVIVKNGRIIGIGAHLKKGEKHAEVQAIDMAGESHVKGATIYVSLEPCSHYGHTPPCAQKIIDTGISKVVYAAKDTTLKDTGHAMLRDHGVEVDYRPHPKATQLYTEFYQSKRASLPIVTVKVSASMDGKQATDDFKSQWITSKAVKKDVFQLRHRHDAILTGNGTLMHDNPSLTTRCEDGHHPAKVILSRSGRIDWQAQLFHDQTTPIYVYTENETVISPWAHVVLIRMNSVEIEAVLKDLYQKGYGRVLVEAGPNVTSQFLASYYVTNFILYVAPKLIGGQGINQFFHTEKVTPLDQLPQFEIVQTDILDTDLKLRLRRK
ncbi:bifunctional diaminohydroxyphosphoribosylaminopyrimidine deaminase/5-amino-6-(5-phosphoribosylamino)uracil reductase RibD [Staphylococcus lutrae]|uniref:Riboflavin biosynthesis protein RibD n=1 Tax=Staphylococcus lutrae TaxID=155085 RepID=A0AAC9WIS0_9STAP|nr:bifunctional diaminohydroxyphosphoribosylaminopyrimidine deaminase/5-amino-6-(5-phosphoribosylamino)uracil reductase RibD [Staphylococcus lutrae]ARJ50056.1 riboflavin biosynthesis protein RibD [Staphylococcus lutrae]PNZ38372.1 bifunctional diaminohydroxyphosphoribosylaminopyrimidine deaminase/5-amino-6-(5-phosphoribosylamino)uracil reductase RibD [Staphylococcus lutrae]